MNLEEIKNNMRNYTDLYGQKLIDSNEIDSAKTKEELASIIERHDSFLISACNDAQNNLEKFQRSLGLCKYQLNK